MRPIVTVYSEVSADGKTTHQRGLSSKAMMIFEDDQVRHYRHTLRARNDAIMVGSNTIRIDDPHLSVRFAVGPSPLRVVPAAMADLPLTSNIFTDGGRTLVVATESAPTWRLEKLERIGVAVVKFPGSSVDMPIFLEYLYAIGIRSIMVEGGGKLLASLFRQHLVDYLIVQHLPVIFGGDNVPAMVGGVAISNVDEAIRATLIEVRAIGKHAVIIYNIN